MNNQLQKVFVKHQTSFQIYCILYIYIRRLIKSYFKDNIMYSLK